MERVIRPLSGEQELLEYARIQLSAYPAIPGPAEKLLERLNLMVEHDDASRLWGVFEDERMIGGMRMLDFQLNYFGQFIPAGGVGSVAVDLPQKKKGTAKDIIQFFIQHYQDKQAYLTLLYPFRPDFYHKMGYGFGQKNNQYSFTPDSLPYAGSRHGVDYLTQDDLPLLEEFCAEQSARQHGFCKKSSFELQGMLRGHCPNRTLVGYKQDGALKGYLRFSFRRGHESNFVKNNMVIHEWLWDGQEALAALCSFLHTQADQINRIIFATQDQNFHFLLADVRNGSDNIIPSVYHETNTAGVGLMYRITGLKEFLQQTGYRNYNGQTINLRLNVTDTFRPENAGEYLLSFQEGKLTLVDKLDSAVDVSIDIAELSTLAMGSVGFGELYRLGKVQTGAGYVKELNKLFAVSAKPECITAF